ncbi:MAG: hypothetical protein IPP77_05115 [Bacteroidetes bacterium]|nr:hypothetical protein [Bacteroidota bacterium]
MKHALLIFSLVAMASCSFFNKKKVLDKDVIARVNEEYLYASDIQPITKGLKGKDSLDALKTFAESWARKKMLLEKARENISDDDIDIVKKVQDYKESLLLYEYEKAYIRQKLDTAITRPELEEWYEKLKSNFPLENDVYLILFIKFKKNIPDYEQARKWILKPKSEEDLFRLEGYCKEFANVYVLEKGMWYDKETLLKNFPLNESDINSLIASKDFKEFKAPEGNWFIRIVSVLKKEEPSPLELVQAPISRVIIEQRRMKLLERVYDKIYQDGLESQSIEILLK